MLIDSDDFSEDPHSELLCTSCHGGDPSSADKETAHTGVVHDPTYDDAEEACGTCHGDIVTSFASSMHAGLLGEHNMIEARAGHSVESDAAMTAGYEVSCAGCHATCGECHVSRPRSAEYGFIKGHVFNKEPDLVNQCTACHGSRVGDEYRGQHRDDIPDYKADVHYLAGEKCQYCHKAAEMHTSNGEHRYDIDDPPACEDCHGDLTNANEYHLVHLGELSCQVCHSQDYKNCTSCHVPDGLDEESTLGFKIARNPLPDAHSVDFVTVRHIPIVPDTYEGWGYTDGLPFFDEIPTWKTTVPHNIALWTTRTEVTEDEECSEACHNTPATADGWFLRQADLDAHPDEAAANAPYIVPDTVPTEW